MNRSNSSRQNELMWNSSNGPVFIADMEIGHLQNTIMYLYKKKKLWDEIQKLAQSSARKKLDGVVINNTPIEEWINQMCTELIKREKEKQKETLVGKKVTIFTLFK